jgi:hypothetical protein
VVELIRQGVLILGRRAGARGAAGDRQHHPAGDREPPREIEIMELVGATAAFIRRPFLYTGAWYGLLGGVAAWLLIAIGLLLLQGPVTPRRALPHPVSPCRARALALLALFGGSALLGCSAELGLGQPPPGRH